MLQTCIDLPPVQTFDVINLGAQPGRAPLGSFLPKGTTIGDAALSADHSTLSVTFADASGRVTIARGADPGKLTVHALPANAKAAAFVNDRRGIAVGLHLGQLWGTVDGAASWFPLAAPVDGDPASVPITERPTCTMLSCAAGSDGSAIVWANPRALRDTGFVQAKLVAAHGVPPDRAYPGLRPAHPVATPYQESRSRKKSVCPESTPPPSRPSMRRR